MERSMTVETEVHARDGESYDLESRLASAEQRYALARARSRKARDECHALELEQETRAQLVKQARARYEAAEAKCSRLRKLIEDIEERLD